MNRYEYLQTVQGQLSLYRQRAYNKMWMSIEQEPKSKKGISAKDKDSFQNKIVDYLKKYHRRGYRSKVAVQFRFAVTGKTPPPVQTLVKNYMDLICKPINGSKIGRKYLLLEDDRLVRALFASYYFAEEPEKPSIEIKISSYRDFLQDMQLIDKIQNNGFAEDEVYPYTGMEEKYSGNSFSWIKDDEDDFNDPLEELNDWRLHKEENVKIAGKKGYKAMENMMIWEVQKKLLKISDYQLGNAFALLNMHSKQPNDSYPNTLFNTFGEIYKSYIDILPICLDLSHIPLEKGETNQFKEKVKKRIKDFKKRYPILMPLLTPVKAIIFLTRPDFKIIFDYDNLARKILPIIVDEMQPPTTLGQYIDTEEIPDTKIKEELAERKKKIAGIKTSVISYQVIELPRTADDPKEGRVRLFLGDGTSYECYWDKITGYLREWADSI